MRPGADVGAGSGDSARVRLINARLYSPRIEVPLSKALDSRANSWLHMVRALQRNQRGTLRCTLACTFGARLIRDRRPPRRKTGAKADFRARCQHLTRTPICLAPVTSAPLGAGARRAHAAVSTRLHLHLHSCHRAPPINNSRARGEC